MRVVLPTTISQFFLILVTPLQKSPSTSFASVAPSIHFMAWQRRLIPTKQAIIRNGSLPD